MNKVLVVLLPILVAVSITMGYKNGFTTQSAIFSGETLYGISGHSKSSKVETNRLIKKPTALFSLGDPDTGGESNFYRWYVNLGYIGLDAIPHMPILLAKFSSKNIGISDWH